MRLLGQRLLVAPNEPITTTPGGIYLPETARQERHSGLVVLIGEEVDRKFEHRKVLYNKLAKTEMTYEGLPVVLLYAHDVIAILD